MNSDPPLMETAPVASTLPSPPRPRSQGRFVYSAEIRIGLSAVVVRGLGVWKLNGSSLHEAARVHHAPWRRGSHVATWWHARSRQAASGGIGVLLTGRGRP